MGRASRKKPARLSKKLLEIRTRLDLSQNGIIRRMGLTDELTQAEVSAFERGIRIPPLQILLEYARVANLYVDALINDSVELPDELPSRKKHESVTLSTPSKRNHG
jgi:transcriptional regulator with XRE-family HTH domain